MQRRKPASAEVPGRQAALHVVIVAGMVPYGWVFAYTRDHTSGAAVIYLVGVLKMNLSRESKNVFGIPRLLLPAACLAVSFLAAAAIGMDGDAAGERASVPEIDPARPWQPHAFRMYGFGLSGTPLPSPDRLAAWGVNLAIHRGGRFRIQGDIAADSKALREDRAAVAALHARGIKAMVSTALVPLRFSARERIDPEFLRHCVLDERGRPYPDKEVRRTSGTREIWICVNHDFWVERFSRGLIRQASLGLDATHIDLAKAAICFCGVCREKWGSHALRRLGEPIPLEQAAGAEDPAVRATYAAYRYQCVLDFVRKARRGVDGVRPGYGLDTTNHMEDRSLYFWTYGRDVFNIACIELTAGRPDWFAPLGEELSSYRLALACLGPDHQVWGLNKMLIPARSAVSPGITMEDASTAERYQAANPGENWQRLNPSQDRQRLYLAQGLAEGVMVNPQSLADHHAKAWGTRRIPYDEIIAAYYNFHKEHAGEFRSARSAARVAVLFSVADALFDSKGFKERFYGLCETLLKAHIPYDVRVLEHAAEIDADRYRLFLVPSGRCLSDAALDFLAGAASRNKTILAFGPLGQRTEAFLRRREPPSLEGVETLDTRLAELLFPFNEDPKPPPAGDLEKRIKQTAGDPIRLGHPDADRLATTLLDTPGGRIVHLFNFNIPTFPRLPEHEQLTRERAVPAENVEIVLALPPGTKVRGIRGLSPDHAPTTLPFAAKGDSVSFKIPRVTVWETVFVDTHNGAASR